MSDSLQKQEVPAKTQTKQKKRCRPRRVSGMPDVTCLVFPREHGTMNGDLLESTSRFHSEGWDINHGHLQLAQMGRLPTCCEKTPGIPGYWVGPNIMSSADEQQTGPLVVIIVRCCHWLGMQFPDRENSKPRLLASSLN